MSKARTSEAQSIESSGAQDNSQERASEDGLLAKAEAAKLSDAMAAWKVDPRQHVRAMVEWVLSTVKCADEEAERAVAGLIAALGPQVKDFVERFDLTGLHRALADFALRCQQASFPKRTPTLEDQIEACKRRFADKKWTALEIGAIRHVAKQGDLIGMIMAASIEINGVKVPRHKFRERIMPAWADQQGLPDREISKIAEIERLAVYEENHPPQEDPDRYKPKFLRDGDRVEVTADEIARRFAAAGEAPKIDDGGQAV